MIRIISTLLFILLFAFPAYSENIDGAFGYTFGQKFNPSASTYKEYTDTGIDYEVKPPKPFEKFSEYWVTTTIKSGQICSISGNNYYDRKYPALEDFKLVKKILISKYGKPKIEKRKHVVFSLNEKLVVLQYNFDGTDWGLYITYQDDRLSKIAEQEAFKVQSNATDKSAL